MKYLVLMLSLAALACVAPVTGRLAMQTLAPSPVPTATRYITATRLPTVTATRLVAVVIAAESLHVRVRPGEQQAVIGYLYHADTVTLTGSCRSGWAQIIWHAASGSGTAWVNARFLSGEVCQTNKE
jgi:uncharacterized protein YgiM (DUF1202 family)